MDDVLKSLTLGLFTLVVLHGGIRERARHNAARQMVESFPGSGTIRVEVEPRGAFGMFTSDIWAVDIFGDHLRSEHLPFAVYPKPGWKGSIRHLRLHYTDFTLAGLPIERFEADIPFVTFDIGHAVWKNRLQMRSAGSGPALVRVGADGLRTFINKKYKNTLSDVSVWFQNRKLYLTATLVLFGSPTRIVASGTLTTRSGRYLDIVQPTFLMNGAILSADATASIVQQFNPVLDRDADLGLGGYFTMETVEIGENFLDIRGSVTVPPSRN